MFDAARQIHGCRNHATDTGSENVLCVCPLRRSEKGV